MATSGIARAAARADMAKRRLWLRQVRRGVTPTTTRGIDTLYPTMILEGRNGDLTGERRVDVVLNPRTVADAIEALFELAVQSGGDYLAELDRRRINVI